MSEMAIEAGARAMCDRVNGIGDYDENIAQRRSGWVQQSQACVTAYLAACEGEVINAPVNGEPDPAWRAIRRAIDQFVGRAPVISRDRAVHNAKLAETVERLDAAGDRQAADTIVWLCWWRAIDAERERFLLADAREQIALATTPARNTSQIGEG